MKGGHYLSTDEVDESIRNDFWRETSSLLYDITPVKGENGGNVSGSVRSRLFGDMVIGNTTFNDQYCARTTRLVAQTDLDFYLLQLILAGDYRGDFDGVDLLARPGDMFIMDLARPMKSKKEAGARITIVIPRRDLNDSWQNKNLHGVVLKGDVATNKLLFNFIISVDSLLGEMGVNSISRAQEALMMLLDAALSGTAFTPGQCLSVSLTMRQRILEYINQNLVNPELGPASIRQLFRLSHSHLYRTFEIENGIAKLIRDKRLDLAYRTILMNNDRLLSIKELAYNCGFSARSQFSKFFQERFGITPKELHGLSNFRPRSTTSAELFHEYIATQVTNRP